MHFKERISEFFKILVQGSRILVQECHILVLGNNILVLGSDILVLEIQFSCTRMSHSCTGEEHSCTGERHSCTGNNILVLGNDILVLGNDILVQECRSPSPENGTLGEVISYLSAFYVIYMLNFRFFPEHSGFGIQVYRFWEIGEKQCYQGKSLREKIE